MRPRVAGHKPTRLAGVGPSPRVDSAWRSSILPVATALIGAVVGAVIGGVFTLVSGDRAANMAAAAEERDLRREAYTEYRSALDAYSTDAALRAESCVPRSDKALSEDRPCEPLLDEYQNSRFVLQGEVNDMHLVASEEALYLVTMIGGILPRANVGLTGTPEDREVPRELFSDLYALFIDVAACDTSRTPPGDCDITRGTVAGTWEKTDHLFGEANP